MKKIAIRRSEVLRAKYMAEIEAFGPNTLDFLDKTGCVRRNQIRQFRYGLRGIHLLPINWIPMESVFQLLVS